MPRHLLLSFLLITGSLFVLGQDAQAKTAGPIKTGSAVKLHYTMKMDGELMYDTRSKSPFEFIYGTTPIMPGLEKAVKGMAAGDVKEVTLKAEDAFGERDPTVVITVPRAKFPPDETIQAGTVYTIPSSEGLPIQGLVKSVNGDEVTIDFNHPLAGKSIDLSIEVIEVIEVK